MGIKGLTKLLSENANGSMKEGHVKNYFGRKVAVDASMTLYQFLIAVRQEGQNGSLTNDVGEVTSHLIGLFYRTIRMMEHGIKPVYVFDGKPPDLKGEELKLRAQRRADAEKELKEAEDADDVERAAQMERRLVKVTKQHCQDAQRLLDALGIPWIQAPGEAEAQCAEMAKGGLVFGTATEDMDALTFGTPRLIRHLTYSEARKMPVLEFNLEKSLELLGLTSDEFIDMCILCGCDYTSSIRGIGYKKAYQFIKQYKNIETILQHIDKNKYKVNEDDFLFERARELFKNPDVTPSAELSVIWNDPDEEKVIEFLVNEKGFALERVQNGLARLKKSKNVRAQQRLDSFFKVMPSANNGKTPKKGGGTKGAAGDKKGNTTAGKKRKLEGAKASSQSAKRTKR